MGFLRVACVLALEPLDTARGIDKLLPASEEGMALGADFQLQLGFRGSCNKRLATRAVGLNVVIILRMNLFLQHNPLFANERDYSLDTLENQS